MKANQLVEELILSVAFAISLHISEVTNMADLVAGTSVSVLMWIEVRTSSHAALAQVAKLMDMEAVLLTRSQAGEVSSDKSTSKRVSLLEPNDTFTDLVGLGVHNADSATRLRRYIFHVTGTAA